MKGHTLTRHEIDSGTIHISKRGRIRTAWFNPAKPITKDQAHRLAVEINRAATEQRVDWSYGSYSSTHDGYWTVNYRGNPSERRAFALLARWAAQRLGIEFELGAETIDYAQRMTLELNGHRRQR